MTEFLLHLVVSSVLLLVVAKVARGVEIDSWGHALLAALVLGVINALVRPIMVMLSLPLTILTFGLFLLVINALVLQMTSALVPGVRINGCIWALLGSIILSLLNFVVGLFTWFG